MGAAVWWTACLSHLSAQFDTFVTSTVITNIDPTSLWAFLGTNLSFDRQMLYNDANIIHCIHLVLSCISFSDLLTSIFIGLK